MSVLERTIQAIQPLDADAIAAVVTAGVRNATAAGVSLLYMQYPGTINTILLADAHLAPAAMVNVVITITEAKTALLGERRVRTTEGYCAADASTDVVVIACTGRGVRQALQEALDAYRP